MRKNFFVSLCREGVLGGMLTVEGDALTYRTGKVTVSPGLRRLRLPLDQIMSVTMGWSFVFPSLAVTMADGERYLFLIFAPRALRQSLEGVGLKVIKG